MCTHSNLHNIDFIYNVLTVGEYIQYIRKVASIILGAAVKRRHYPRSKNVSSGLIHWQRIPPGALPSNANRSARNVFQFPEYTWMMRKYYGLMARARRVLRRGEMGGQRQVSKECHRTRKENFSKRQFFLPQSSRKI